MGYVTFERVSSASSLPHGLRTPRDAANALAATVERGRRIQQNAALQQKYTRASVSRAYARTPATYPAHGYLDSCSSPTLELVLRNLRTSTPARRATP